MNSKHLGLIQIVKKFFVKNKNGGLKQIRKEEQRKDHQKLRKLWKDFKKIVYEKMRLNVEDESDTSLISMKFWKYVESKTYLIRVPETVWYKNQFRRKPIDQANLFNEFFFNQFPLEIKYDIEIDMESNDRFFDVKFHELES